MLMSIMYEVQFKVEASTVPGEVVCVSGDCTELGNWDPNKAVTLQKDAQKNHWSRKIQFTSLQDVIKYRYFIANVITSDHEDYLERSVMVTSWETNVNPRSLSVSGKNVKKETDDKAVFGDYDGRQQISRGWLIDQSQINIRLHGNPFKIWNQKYRDETFRIKCTPIDHRNNDDDDDSDLIEANNTTVNVSVLEKGRSEPQLQGKFGTVFTTDCSMTFMIQTLEPEHLGFRLELFVDNNKDNDTLIEKPPQQLGYAFILPLEMSPSIGRKTVPLINVKHRPLGQIQFNYLIIKPMRSYKCDMSVSYQNYWKSTRKPLDIGHRGMGTSFSEKKISSVPENTVHSFNEAAKHGADMVEFDVHLTKDRQAIIYHDFKVKITYKKRQGSHLDVLEVPVKDLNFSELKDMKLWHKPRPDNVDELHEDDVFSDDMQSFPLLETVLKQVDIHTGFNIELKYPQEMQSGTHEQDNYHDLNEFLDTILKVVFEHHGGRRIVFSTFDCDTCIGLRLKQNRWPILFLTEADTTVYPWYKDKRTQCVIMGTEFCIAHGLLGVNVMSEILLRNISLVDYIKQSGLVLFTWGEDNNNTEVIAQMKQYNVGGIIYDRIDHYKIGDKESIFKMEHREKLKVLQEKFGHDDINSNPIVINMTNGVNGS
ncbi:hypothetical protein ACF0H5_022204 [Mactra antiquata]